MEVGRASRCDLETPARHGRELVKNTLLRAPMACDCLISCAERESTCFADSSPTLSILVECCAGSIIHQSLSSLMRAPLGLEKLFELPISPEIEVEALVSY